MEDIWWVLKDHLKDIMEHTTDTLQDIECILYSNDWEDKHPTLYPNIDSLPIELQIYWWRPDRDFIVVYTDRFIYHLVAEECESYFIAIPRSPQHMDLSQPVIMRSDALERKTSDLPEYLRNSEYVKDPWGYMKKIEEEFS